MQTSKLTLTATILLAALAGRPTHAMDGGTVIAPADWTQTGTAMIKRGAQEECTGTLLAPTWLLTAEHCAIPIRDYFNGGTDAAHLPPASTDDAAAVATLWDATGMGRWIVAGWASPAQHHDDTLRELAIAAISTGGAYDTTFGSGGFVSTMLTGVHDAEGITVLQEPSGLIRSPVRPVGFVLVGRARVGTQNQMVVVRYDAAGTFDAAPWAPIGGGGRIAYPAVSGVPTSAVFATNGLIVAGHDDSGATPRWAAVRYNADGTLDPAFAPFFATPAYADGEILDVITVGTRVAWLGRVGGTYRVALSDALGHLDGVPVDVDPAVVPSPSRLAAHGTGALWVVGSGDAPWVTVHAGLLQVPGLAPAGGWPAGGAVMTLAGHDSDIVEVAAAREDGAGRLVVGGTWTIDGTARAMLVRFDAQGHPDPTFGQSGVTMTNSHTDTEIGGIARSPDGSIMIVGNEAVHAGANHGRTLLWTAAFNEHTDASSGQVVQYGAATSSILHVYHHPNATIDIALYELATPLATTVPFAGIYPASDATGKSAMCFGYGTFTGDNHGAILRLHTGMFTIDGHEGRDLVMVSNPALIREGDSGGACYVERDGVKYLAGVTRASFEKRRFESTFYSQGTKQYFIDPGDFRVWVEQVTHVTMLR